MTGRGSTASIGRRLRVLATLTFAGFVLIAGQLWYLQIFEGPRLSELSERNRVRVRPLIAPRGTLYDRNRLPLVDTRPGFALLLIPRELGNREVVLARLSILLRIPVTELEADLTAAPDDSPRPIRIGHRLAFEDVIRVEEWRPELPGVLIEAEPRRGYASSHLAAHVLGYVREASAEQVREGRYRPGALVGQSGLERLLDEFLRGRDGAEYVEVDASDEPVRVLRREEFRPGASVITTLDRRVQEAGERALGDAPGAVVVMDPRQGEILAMVSSPAFDLTSFTGSLDRREWLRLVQDPTHPLLNRAFQTEYPPGSVFKLVVAAAALQEAIVTPLDTLPCPPSITVGNRQFRNWTDQDLGSLNLQRAIAMSCNTFFYRLGLRVGIERIARYAEAFGFGRPTGIGLRGERPGLLPGPGGAGSRRRTVWLPGDTANAAVGQGKVLVTPLQVAGFMAALANGGVLWRPRLVQRLEPSARDSVSFPTELAGHISLAPAVFAVLRRALWSAVNEGGTGAAAAVPGLAIAGKTGTAQLVSDSDAARGQDHAWFAGYAPADDPRVVVVVLVERGGMGGRVAAPVARRVFEDVFRASGPGTPR